MWAGVRIKYVIRDKSDETKNIYNCCRNHIMIKNLFEFVSQRLLGELAYMDYKLGPLMIALITNYCKTLGIIRSEKMSTLSKGTFHLSELTGHTIPVAMSSLNQNSPARSFKSLNSTHELRRRCFRKTYWKN